MNRCDTDPDPAGCRATIWVGDAMSNERDRFEDGAARRWLRWRLWVVLLLALVVVAVVWQVTCRG